MSASDLIDLVPRGFEIAGVGVIVVGSIVATLAFFWNLRPTRGISDAYRVYRQGIGQAILLGLEFLVAADIVRSVAISPTFTSVGVLAGIVLIRTFLSFTLELEIEGHWPWQHFGPAISPAPALPREPSPPTEA
jgi:uncharacterized membrane protein